MSTVRTIVYAIVVAVGLGLLAVVLPGHDVAAQAGVPTVPPTSTPDAEGVIYAEVQEDDSFWSIAARHGISLEELYELNDAEPGDFVHVGDLLIVGYGEPPATETPTRGPTEEATAAPPTPTPPLPTATPTVTRGEVCLRAFADKNQNKQQDADEPLRAAVAFTLYDDDQVLVNYVTDGVSEPYCLTLDAGNYRITRSQLPNEVLTTDAEWAVSVAPGSSQEFEFGSYLEESAVASAASTGAVAQTTAAPAAAQEGGVTRFILIAAVVVAVLLFLGVLVIVLSARRSAT